MEPLVKQVSGRLSQARRINVDGQWFVPRPDLDEIINKDTISKIISKGGFSPYKNDPAFAVSSLPGQVEEIHRGARLAFAILCELGLDYLSYIFNLENYGDSEGFDVDYYLPFTEDNLISCNLHRDHAAQFEKTQWHFMTTRIRLGIPVVHDFHPKRILPITSPQPRRAVTEVGAFGAVTEVKIEPGHQVEPVYFGNIVRKQFHSRVKKQAYEKEIRNLSILSSRPHKNIVPLLSAYVQGKSFNLLFPLITQGNLALLFHSDGPSAWEIMKSDEILVMAIAGLASALSYLHHFSLDNLHLAGSHRDIKPENILVDGEHLLLADFGLSRITEDQESSSSTAPNIAGDCIAPEHERKDDFKRHPTGRASDIWALGCVILMLLMFYREGKAGFERGRTERRQQGPQYTHYYFHDYDKPNPGVQRTLGELARNGSPLSGGLLFLIREMLVIDKSERPKASAVDEYLRSLAIYLRAKSVEKEFTNTCKQKDSYIPIFVEQIRFQSWRSAAEAGDSDFPALSNTFAGSSSTDFHTIMDHLESLRQLLGEFTVQNSRALFPLRARIDRLLKTLDGQRHTSAEVFAENELLKSPIWLSQLGNFPEEALDNRTKGKLATKRRVLGLSAAPLTSHGNLRVDFDALETTPQPGIASKVRLLSSTGSETVLAEECSHIARYVNEGAYKRHSNWISARLQETAELLELSGQSSFFKVLRCRGYYYDHRKLRSGLLYKLPNNPTGALQSTITLRQLLQRDEWLLGDRFRLAHGLALALFELHTVSWLHHNISASNVIFFSDEHEAITDPKSFFFVGFAQSRADRDLTESDGPTQAINDEGYYVHQEYSSGRQGFQAQHDYYALGILLIEIAFWQLYSKITPDDAPRDGNVQSIKADATMELLARVGARMGAPYQ